MLLQYILHQARHATPSTTDNEDRADGNRYRILWQTVCGTSECRTVEVEGTTFETIPETLFLRAALVASSQLLSVDSGTQG